MNNEDAYHFSLGGSVDEGDADVSLTCLRCTSFHEWIEVSTEEDGPGVLLAEVIQRGEEHVDTCPALRR